MTSFSQTIHRLDADGSRATSAGLFVAIALLAGWLAWAALAHITLHATTSRARVEVAQAITPVQSPMLGKVTRAWLEIGREVHAGDPLIELDASAQRFEADEQRARQHAISDEAAALRSQLAAENAAAEAERRTLAAAVDEARAALGHAEAIAQFANAQAERASALHAQGVTSVEERGRASAEAEQANFAAARARAGLERVQQEQHARASERAVRLRRLEAGIAHLTGEAATLEAVVARLENEIERRLVRAPIDGRIAEAVALRAGAVLDEAERVAALAPAGPFIVVAEFAAADALGRIRPGLRATVRLDGFPWAEYGALHATVARVASEIRDGTVRIELALSEHQPGRVPLQHGLPGTVEVDIERVTPLALVLRAAGGLASRDLAQR